MDNTEKLFENLQKLNEKEKLTDEELNRYRKMDIYKKACRIYDEYKDVMESLK